MNINEAAAMLAKKYSVDKKIEINPNNTVTIDDKTYPLMSWRNERRFIEFKNLASGEYVKGISTMRICRIDSADKDLFDIFYREADICSWVLSDKFTEVFAIKNDKALNAILQTKKGYVCSFEIAATLSGDAEIVDKHEIIAEKGVICDRGIDVQIPQSSIYVLGADGTKDEYTDVDAELFGLSYDDCAKVRQAFSIAKNSCDLTEDAEHIKAVCSAAKKSCEMLENIIL